MCVQIKFIPPYSLTLIPSNTVRGILFIWCDPGALGCICMCAAFRSKTPCVICFSASGATPCAAHPALPFLSAPNLYPGAYLTSVFGWLVVFPVSLFVSKLLISESRCRSRQPNGCWALLGPLNTNLQEVPGTYKNLGICIWMVNQRHKCSMTQIKLLVLPTTPNLFFPPISPRLSKRYCHLPSCPSQAPRNYARFFFFVPTTSNPLAKVGDSANKIS